MPASTPTIADAQSPVAVQPMVILVCACAPLRAEQRQRGGQGGDGRRRLAIKMHRANMHGVSSPNAALCDKPLVYRRKSKNMSRLKAQAAGSAVEFRRIATAPRYRAERRAPV
jgi:hypothetical protein